MKIVYDGEGNFTVLFGNKYLKLTLEEAEELSATLGSSIQDYLEAK